MITRLGSDRYPLLLQHLLSLSADERYLRFIRPMSDEAIANWVKSLNPARDEVYAHLGVGSSGIEVLAAAVAQPYIDRGRSIAVAELSVTVDPRRRRTGLALATIEAAMNAARQSHIGEVQFEVCAANRPMRQLLRKLSATEEEGVFSLALSSARHEKSERAGSTERITFGDERAPIALCVHGAGGDAWQFRRQAFQALADHGYRVVAPTLSRLSFDSFAACPASERDQPHRHSILEAIESLRGERPSLIVGHSLGAVLATKIADKLDTPKLLLANPMPLDGMSDTERRQSVAALGCERARFVLQEYSGFAALPRQRRRVAVMHGLSDRVASLEYALRSTRHCRASEGSALVQSKAGHLGIQDAAALRVSLDRLHHGGLGGHCCSDRVAA